MIYIAIVIVICGLIAIRQTNNQKKLTRIINGLLFTLLVLAVLNRVLN